jgi:hypothetical protein
MHQSANSQAPRAQQSFLSQSFSFLNRNGIDNRQLELEMSEEGLEKFFDERTVFTNEEREMMER